LGLQAQREAILRRFRDAELVEEVRSAGKVSSRPVLRRVLDGLRRGDILAVSKLDRLCRNALDLLRLAERAERDGWSIVLLDLGLDTGTAAGRMALTVFAALAEFERSRNIERVCDAVDAADSVKAERRARIRELRANGVSERAIAAEVGCSRATVTRELRRPRPA
jgi:DNA invertase Pin-like site-specific DNA recombinase